MSNEINTMCEIDETIGTVFSIELECNPGSTGYSWALAHMPEGVNLLDISFGNSNSMIFGTSIKQIFTFVAVQACQDLLKFNLVRPWDALNPAEQRAYPLMVCEPIRSDEEELENCIGNDRFVDTCTSSACCSTNLAARPYMAPFDYSSNAMYMAMSADNVATPDNCVGVGCVKYAPPIIYKYAAPTNFKYAAPTNYKYSAPTNYKYAAPTPHKYAAPVKPEESCEECTNAPGEDDAK